jgi:hypothetical protein
MVDGGVTLGVLEAGRLIPRWRGTDKIRNEYCAGVCLTKNHHIYIDTDY